MVYMPSKRQDVEIRKYRERIIKYFAIAIRRGCSGAWKYIPFDPRNVGGAFVASTQGSSKSHAAYYDSVTIVLQSYAWKRVKVH
jgi:hypothetical protein